ncbi:unnamed protein product [Coccothraustes coccothraustes]
MYPYKSPAGHRLIVLQFRAFGWFCNAIAIAVTIVLEYRYFYLPFLGAYALCFFIVSHGACAVAPATPIVDAGGRLPTPASVVFLAGFLFLLHGACADGDGSDCGSSTVSLNSSQPVVGFSDLDPFVNVTPPVTRWEPSPFLGGDSDINDDQRPVSQQGHAMAGE